MTQARLWRIRRTMIFSINYVWRVGKGNPNVNGPCQSVLQHFISLSNRTRQDCSGVEAAKPTVPSNTTRALHSLADPSIVIQHNNLPRSTLNKLSLDECLRARSYEVHYTILYCDETKETMSVKDPYNREKINRDE